MCDIKARKGSQGRCQLLLSDKKTTMKVAAVFRLHSSREFVENSRRLHILFPHFSIDREVEGTCLYPFFLKRIAVICFYGMIVV